MPRIGEAFGADGDPALNLNIQVTFPPRNPYAPGDQPAYADRSGPDCRDWTASTGRSRRRQSGEYYCPYPPNDGVESDGER